jgi:hypothetical protein
MMLRIVRNGWQERPRSGRRRRTVQKKNVSEGARFIEAGPVFAAAGNLSGC